MTAPHTDSFPEDIQRRLDHMESQLTLLGELNTQVSAAISDWIGERASTDQIAHDLGTLSRALASVHMEATEGIRLLATLGREVQPSIDQLRGLINRASTSGTDLAEGADRLESAIGSYVHGIEQSTDRVLRSSSEIQSSLRSTQLSLDRAIAEVGPASVQAMQDMRDQLTREISQVREVLEQQHARAQAVTDNTTTLAGLIQQFKSRYLSTTLALIAGLLLHAALGSLGWILGGGVLGAAIVLAVQQLRSRLIRSG